MNYKLLLIVTLVAIVPFAANSRTVTGKVYGTGANGEKTELPGANVYNKNKSEVTDAEGNFSIGVPEGKYLYAAYLGYSTDSVLITTQTKKVNFNLTENGENLSEALVTARLAGTYFSMMDPQKTELISKTGLMKMACCNLSESFENSASVTVGFTDAVSGAKQVQLLGLSGIYTQMLAENIPTLRGLASTYGWSFTPGPWLESIQISKGASAVQNGYESVTGQINLEFKKPNNTEPLFINLFSDDAGRYEGNITAATKVSDKLWTGLLLHASTESKEHDNNDDGFMDMPKTKFVNAYNRWYYENPDKQVESRTGVKFLYETREGGQLSNIANRYETAINNKNFSVYNKTGFGIGSKGQSFGIINSLTYHDQQSELGYKTYAGDQLSYYANVLYSSFIGNTNHKYTTGASFAYDKYQTNFTDKAPYNNTALTPINREEVVPGAFLQYTYSYLEKFVFILGGRADYNSHYNWLLTPRANLKYSLSNNVVFRLSAGKGYRSPNVIAENIGLMASSRKFDMSQVNNLDIERAWNYGANVSFSIPVYNGRKAMLSLDYFRTDFNAQTIVDAERDPSAVYFYNLQGKSYANAWQADLTFSPLKGLDLFTAFRYNDTKMSYTTPTGNNMMVEKPLVSRYRGLINVSYATNLRKWVFDATAQINGPARIPSLSGYAANGEYSPVFPVYFAQVTKNFKRFDIYLGVENIADFKQSNPIINPDKPFEKGFDSSLIWGPLMGRKIYGGIRLRIGEIK